MRIKYTLKDFIERANKIHKNRYNYSKTIYKDSKTKVTIICPEHGDFNQVPYSHLQGRGCSKCSIDISKLTTEEFIKKSIKIHNNKFDYSKTIYTGSKDRLIIICPIHGDFEQTATSHLQGADCLKCVNGKQTKTTDQFIKDAKKVHGSIYKYSKTKYINKKTKVLITCRKHGDFEQVAGNHLSGKICKKCSNEVTQKYAWTKTSFTNLSPTATLYTLRCFNDNEDFIKIGITIKTVKERYSYSDIAYNYQVLDEIKAPSDVIYDLEKYIHRTLKPFKYTPKIKFDGYTECFKLSSINDK